MIVLSTDFGLEGPYIGQVKAAIYQQAPDCHIIDLFSDLPAYNPLAAASLLAAYCQNFPEGTVFLSVVDPGVGMSERSPVVVKACGYCFVGPANGLFDLVMKRDSQSQMWLITWQPETLSNSFHGRDLFAPIAAELALGMFPEDKLSLMNPLDLSLVDCNYSCIAYIDHFGNLISGIQTGIVPGEAILELRGEKIAYTRTFGESDPGALFWYENSNGLIEIAANCASAAKILGAEIGDNICLQESLGN